MQDPVVEPLEDLRSGRPRKGKALDLHVAVEPDMDLGERRTGPVDEVIAPRHRQFRGVRVEVQHQGDVRNVGLGQALVLQEAFLVVGQKDLAFLLRPVGVPDIGIQEDEASQAGEDQEGTRGGQSRPALQPVAEARQPGLDAVPGAPGPEPLGQDQKEDGESRPVGAEPGREAGIVALAVHVREGNRRAVAIAVEFVLEAGAGQAQLQHQEDNHQGPAHELVGRQGLQEDGQNRDQGPVGEGRQHIPANVLAPVRMRKSQQDLGEHGGQGAHEEHGAEHHDEPKDLWDQEGPVRGGGGVDNVGKAPLAIAPDKFASVVDGHQDDDETEGALQHFDHAQGGGQEGGPVLLQAQEDAAQGIDEPQHDENAKGWAVKDLAGLKAGPVKGLNPLGQQPLLRRRDPRRGRRGGGAGCRQGHLGGIPPGLCRATSPGLEAEYQAGASQGDQPQDGPQQPVGQKHSRQLG